MALIFILLGAAKNGLMGQVRFVENKGQWRETINFRAEIPSGLIFFESNSILYHFVNNSYLKDAHNGNPRYAPPEYIQHHAFRMNLIGAVADPVCTGNRLGEDYENFFLGNNEHKWASHVRNFGGLQYSGIYPGIDLSLEGKKNGLKYDFLLAKGADPNQIEIEYEGLKSIYIRKGDLYLKTVLNELIEMAPVAYQLHQGDTLWVECRFKLKKNRLTFRFPEGYNPDLDLVIDPHLVFSTYSGSMADNWGFTATPDSRGGVFSGGIVKGVGYPTTLGAYQEDYQNSNGGWDVAIIKYDRTGTHRIWASYLGAEKDEMPHSLVVDSHDNLLVFGTTGSGKFPTTKNAYDTTFNGGSHVNYANDIKFPQGVDIFVSKLSRQGDQLIGSTFVGGKGNDGINYRPRYNQNDSIFNGTGRLYYNYGDGARGEIICDKNDNVLVASCTFSNDFPVVDAFQANFGGLQDAIVFCLSDSLSELQWSTYLGGRNDDAAYSIEVSPDETFYVAGGTTSRNFPTTSTSLFPNFLGGKTDGFITRFSISGYAYLSSTHFGTSYPIAQYPGSSTFPVEENGFLDFDFYDQIFFVRADEQGKVYITGQTDAPGNLLIHNAIYNNPNSGQFIAKLSAQLDSLEWSTVFGSGDGEPDISITAFDVGINDMIYLSGWGRQWYFGTNWNSFTGIKNMDVTPTAFQTTSDGMDFYVLVLSDDAACLEYATFFGEEHYSGCSGSGEDHVDGGTSRFDKKGYIYQAACASCGGCQKFPVYPANSADSVWSVTNNSQNCNNAVFKFGFETPDYLPTVHRCEHEEVHLGRADLTADTELSFSWYPDKLVDNPTAPNPTPVLPINDSVVFSVEVTRGHCTVSYLQRFYQHDLTLEIPGRHVMCDIDSFYLPAIVTLGSAEVVWSSDPNFTDTLNQTDTSFWAKPKESGFYYCKASNPYCEESKSVWITVHNVSVNAQQDFTICYGDTIELTAISEYTGQNVSYTWTPAEAILEGGETASPTIFVEENTDFTVYAINHAIAGCEDYDELTVYISPFSATTNEIIEQEIDSIFDSQSIHVNTNASTLLDFNWTTELDILNPTSPTLMGTPEHSGYYYLSVTDQYSCSREDSLYVFVEDVFCNEDHVYVPNAFSPNGDGKNDILLCQSRMTDDIVFMVYNRWGQKVFETTNLAQGWDGTYKGVPEPEGVFIYYIQATCWNKTTFEKKGNVTLVR